LDTSIPPSLEGTYPSTLVIENSLYEDYDSAYTGAEIEENIYEDLDTLDFQRNTCKESDEKRGV